MNQDVAIRPYCKDDEAFIYSTWLKHYKHSSDFAARIPAETFFRCHRLVIDRIMHRRKTVRIAHLKEDPSVIIGFLVMEGTNEDPVVHFIFVKSAFRQMGVGKVLCKGIELGRAEATHFTKSCEWVIKKFPTIQYNPYKA